RAAAPDEHEHREDRPHLRKSSFTVEMRRWIRNGIFHAPPSLKICASARRLPSSQSVLSNGIQYSSGSVLRSRSTVLGRRNVESECSELATPVPVSRHPLP